MSNDETFDTQNLIKISYNTFMSNFQVLMGTLLLKSIVVNQRVHTTWCYFFHWPLGNIKNQVNPLMPNDPREATPQEKPNTIERF